MATHLRPVLRLRFSSLLFVVFLVTLMLYGSLHTAHAEIAFVWPVQGKVITEYKDTGYEDGGHRGIDIESSVGTPVLAAADGEVYWVRKNGADPGIGIKHSGGMRTTYLPVATNLSVGAVVRQGDPLGTVVPGDSSCSASHLHFGVKVPPYGSPDYLDPVTLLPPLAAQAQKPDAPQEVVSGSALPSDLPANPEQIPMAAGTTPPAPPLTTDSLVTSQTEPIGSAGSAAASQGQLAGTANPPPNGSSINAPADISNARSSVVPGAKALTAAPSADSAQLAVKENPSRGGGDSEELLNDSPLESGVNHQAALSKNVGQGHSALVDTGGYSSAETTDSGCGQIALLCITALLTLLFMLKKRIVSCLSSQRMLKTSFLRGTC